MAKIVIIGGGFTGSLCTKKLQKDFEVTLIDTKDYFEFTPGILRTIVEPHHINSVQIRHRDYFKNGRLVIGEVEEVTKDKVILDDEKIEYDYLIVASGSRYELPIKEQRVLLSHRAHTLFQNHENLEASNYVLIVGGGITGVELASEIAEKYDEKDVTLVHSRKELMNRYDEAVSRYGKNFLEKKGVNLVLGERVVAGKNNEFQTKKGKTIKTDLAFMCTGIKPNYEFMKNNFSGQLSKNNYLRVNKHFQLESYNNIFVGGDIAATKEEKAAQNAEKHAKVIVKNIKRMAKGKKLKKYVPKKRPMVISLGKYKGIFTYKMFVLNGIIPAFMKKFIEWKTMFKYKFSL